MNAYRTRAEVLKRELEGLEQELRELEQHADFAARLQRGPSGRHLPLLAVLAAGTAVLSMGANASMAQLSSLASTRRDTRTCEAAFEVAQKETATAHGAILQGIDAARENLATRKIRQAEQFSKACAAQCNHVP